MYNMSGGLSGKARREHQRSRATRLYTEQLIAEYDEVEESPALARVPIRRRGEFLPTAPGFVASENPSDSGAGMQLDLPLVGPITLADDETAVSTLNASKADDDSVAHNDGAIGIMNSHSEDECVAPERSRDGALETPRAPVIAGDEPAAESTESSSSRQKGPVRRRALGMRTMSRPPVGWAKERVAQPVAIPFNVRGFAVGCAMGGTAAAVVLLIGRLVLG